MITGPWFWRTFWTILAFGLALAVANTAVGASPHATALTREAAVASIADETAAWLADTLHAEVDPPTSVLVTNDLGRSDSIAERRYGGEVAFRPVIASALLLRLPMAYRRDGAVYSIGPHAVVHEAAHRDATVACWGRVKGISVEEGVTEAITAQVLPAWGWRFWRVRMFAVPLYPRDVAAIRAASARATGSRTWRARPALLWVRRLWAASCDGRAAMLGAVPS